MKRQNPIREVNQVKPQAPLTGSQRQQEVNDQIFRHVQDMFDGKVDGDVVFIILQELEWNVEKAIDTLCTMCGSQIDATKKKSKLTEIARDVLCLDKKNKFSHQSTQNLMPSEFPALGSLPSSDRPNSRESTPNVVDAQRLDKKKSPVSQQRDHLGNATTNVNTGNELIRLTTPSGYNAGTSSPGSLTPVQTSPRHVGVIGEKINRKSRDSSLSPGGFVSPSKYSEEDKNIESYNGLPKLELPEYRSERLTGYDEVQGGSFPSFHDNSGSEDVSLDFAQLDPRKSNKIRSSHNSLDDIDENFEEELDFKSSSKKLSTPLVPFSEGIGHSILAGALNLTTSQDNGIPTSVEEKCPMLGTEQLPHHISQTLGGSIAPVSSLWPQNTNDRNKSSLNESASSYVLSNFSQPSAHGTSRYSFANKSAFNLRHDSGEFDIDSLIKESNLNGLHGASQNQGNSDQVKEAGSVFQDHSDQLSVDSSEAVERPNSTEMQLPVLSFELSVTAKEFVPRLQKEDDSEQADEQSDRTQPHFVMPKMGKPLDGGIPIQQPRIPNQFVPGFRLPRAPFGMQMRPPWPPRGARGSIPRGMPPWMQHFPNFPEPRGAPPFLPPGGVLPVQRSGKTSAEANERDIERVSQRIASGAEVLVVLRGLPGSGKSTLARQLVGDGQILSTDDYFWENKIYSFDVGKLAEAHEWNRKRAEAAMEERCTPVIIDNTNTQSWEIKPYLKLGKAFSYEMELLEPNTPWKYSVKELARRNDHGVSKEHIQKMKERYQRDLTVELILGSPVKKTKIENGDKPKDVEFSAADFPELRNSQPGRGSPFNSSRKDSLDQEVFLTRPEDFKESESSIKFRKNSGDSGRECSTIGSDTDSEKRLEKEFDQLSDSRQSPIPNSIGYVARSHVAMSPSNIHKQLEIITKRKTLMSPPVSQGVRQKEETCPKTVEYFTVSTSTANITDTNTAGEDIEGKVESLIMENVGSCWNTDLDQDKIIDELKSWILFMDIDPTQHMQVEKMIEEKIKILSTSCDNEQGDIKEQNSADEGNVISEFREITVSKTEVVWDTPMDQRSKKKNIHKNSNSERDLKPDNGNGDNSTHKEVQQKDNIESDDKDQMTETIPKSNVTSELNNIKASELLYWSKQENTDTDIVVSSDSWENKEPLGQRQVSTHPQRNSQASDTTEAKVAEKSDAQSLVENINSAMNSKHEDTEPFSDTSNLSKSIAGSPTEPQASAPKRCEEASESTSKKPSSVVCEANKISLQDENVHEKDKAKSLKKNSKRKMAARFPLLNDSDRAKLAVNDWTAIKVDSLDDVKSDNVEKKLSVNDSNVVIKVDSETEITPHDLNIMHDLSRGTTDSSKKPCKVVIIEGKEWKVNSTYKYSEKNSKSSNVMTVHRSTMTEDFLEADIEFLKNSFPTIPEADLKDVLQSCDNNVEWAADIILDWNFHDISLSQEDKNKYLDSMFKVQHVPKSPTIPARSRSSSSMCVGEQSDQPALLIDICIKYLEDTNIATKEDIENQLIANSEKRMLSYESNIRTCQQFSRGNEGDEIFIEDEEFNRMILQELVAIAEDEPANDSVSLQNVSKLDQSLNSSYVDSPQSGVFEEVVDTSQVSDAGFIPVTESPANLTLSLELPSDFIQALLSLFGSVGNLTPAAAEALTIPVDYITAQRLHQCLKTEHVEIHVNRRQQISEDEAFAQQLQSEMNNSVCRSTEKSMHLIMQEQLQEEERKANLKEDLKASGLHNTIGNRMKRQKLHEEFPAIDPSVLDEIFQANCFSYADTVRAVKGSLGSNEPPKTVMTAEAADKYERKLIEAAKQQSLQEMIDSYTYRPKVKKEYQSAENPEYEDIRGEANLHYRLRHECFQKAQEAFRRGMKQVAHFYSNQGHLHTKKIKEANENAAQMILSRRVEYLETKSTLDLHGLHVDEAVTVLSKVIEDQRKKLCGRGDKKKDLFIITGRGSHSRGGVARIRPAVIRWLKQNNYNFAEVNEGLLKLRLF
ncbi:NEDD4-binding protein 2-like [Saccostrea cucullata]|uniref:NEDD4-binding protein 2-like n=1 Tax=Saccostrea cuccullata TaxID=36930 RepID=UPI002ED3EBC0